MDERINATSFDFAHENLQNSFCRQKRYNDNKLKSREFEINSLVLRWYPPDANQKLGLGWIGPYKIVRKISDITYEIERCADKRKIVHVDHLKLLVLPEYDDNVDVDETNEILVNIDSVETNPEFANYEDHNEISVKEVHSPKRSRTGRLIKPPTVYSP